MELAPRVTLVDPKVAISPPTLLYLHTRSFIHLVNKEHLGQALAAG